jgi:hypothetical protein
MSFPPDLDESQQLPSGVKQIDFHTAHPLFLDLCPEDSYTEDGTYWVSHFRHHPPEGAPACLH